jgi:hypothetical protein
MSVPELPAVLGGELLIELEGRRWKPVERGNRLILGHPLTVRMCSASSQAGERKPQQTGTG